MPGVTANATEAILQSWNVTENQTFAVGDTIAVIETEKAVVDVEADEAGVILRALVEPGSVVEVGMPLAVLADAGEEAADVDELLGQLGVALSADEGEPRERIFASPLARRLAGEVGLRLADLTGTGPGGRIVRRDIEAATQHDLEPSALAVGLVPTSTPSTGYHDVPHSRIRRATANRLVESKQTTPHFYLRGSAQVDALGQVRESLNRASPVRISVNDLVVMAVVRAHQLVPDMNVVWLSDAVRKFETVDIAVAVATERGLVTPVLRSVERMRASDVARTMQDLTTRAREGRLQADELEGGTCTVTNLGMFGTEEFAAIINPPQSAILAVGAIRTEPVARDGSVTVADVMRVTLSVDHRPVDGVVAAQWLRAFLSLLEDPVQLLA